MARMNLTTKFIDELKEQETKFKLLKVLYSPVEQPIMDEFLRSMGMDPTLPLQDTKINEILNRGKNISVNIIDDMVAKVNVYSKIKKEENGDKNN